MGFDVLALDFSPTAIDLARRHAREARVKVRFKVQDMRDLSDLRGGTFGLVVDHRAIHCVTRLPQRAQLFSEIFRVLEPGGMFYSSTIAGLPRSQEMLAAIDLQTRANTHHTRYFGEADDILAEIRRPGFAIAAWQVISEPFVVDNLIVYARKPRPDD